MGVNTTVNVFYGAEIIDPPSDIYELCESLGMATGNNFGIEILEGDCNEVKWYMYMCLKQPYEYDYPNGRIGLWKTLGMSEHDPSAWWYEQSTKMSDYADDNDLTLGEFDHWITVIQR